MTLEAATRAFQPTAATQNSTVSIAATTASGTVALPTPANPGDPDAVPKQYAVWNAGSTYAFVAFGPTSTVAAGVPTSTSAGAYPVPPTYGEPEVISVPPGPLPAYMAAIMATSTATLYVAPGNGKN